VTFAYDLNPKAQKILTRLKPLVSIRNYKLRPGNSVWIALLVGLSALYSFGIGRSRYQTKSDFLVRQPIPPGMVTPTVLGGVLGGPTISGSLEDGRFLEVYLRSPEVMKRVFYRFYSQGLYARRSPDLLAGVGSKINKNQLLSLYQRQVSVMPQQESGVIELTTTGLDPTTALKLNLLLLEESQEFVNKMNQTISRKQLDYALQEVKLAQDLLDNATANLNSFNISRRQLDPVQEASGSTNYIIALEAKLVELKVEEGTLRRQYRDPQSPEVLNVADQVRELEKQIQKERASLVSPTGRNFGRRALEAMKLQNKVIFATESLKSAMTAAETSRMESQRQLKFLVILSQPQIPEMQDWNWRWKLFLGIIISAIALRGFWGFVAGLKARP
jgi:capsular polysaccharide transport system permease protein